MIKEFDTVVIGASLSGSVAACLLARAGQRVALIDSQVFPRQKACGEGLSVLGKSYLESLGLWSPELGQCSHPFKGYKITFQDGKTVCLSNRQCEGVGVSRVQLDSHIYACATAESLVEMLQIKVSSCLSLGSDWLVEMSNGTSVQAKRLICAAGAVAASRLFPNLDQVESRKGRFGMAFWCDGYWESSTPDTVNLTHQQEGQYLITPLSETRINVSILLNKEHRGISKREVLLKAMAVVAQAGFTVVSKTATRGAAAIHGARLCAGDSGVFFLGDALERFDPIGGMGMTHAVFSADCAVRAILNNLESPANALSEYYRKRKKGSSVLRLLTDMSFRMNVEYAPSYKWVVLIFPAFNMWCMSLVKSLFPKTNKFLYDSEEELVAISSHVNETVYQRVNLQ